jgi:hypothetical protein
MNAYSQISLDPEMQRRAEEKAAQLGMTFSEYVRSLVAMDLRHPEPTTDISCIFDLVTDGEPTDIARDKHRMIGDALWDEYLEDTGRKPRRGK